MADEPDNTVKQKKQRPRDIAPYIVVVIVILLGLTQFSLFGKVIYLVYAALVSLVVVVAPALWLLRNKQWKWQVILPIGLPLLAAPPAEELWIAKRFEVLCEDAGVYVYKKAVVDGFYDSTMRSGYELIDKYGYRFMEHPSLTSGKVDHVTKVDTEWVKEVLDQPQARYHYKNAYQLDPYTTGAPMGWKIGKSERIVVDSRSDEVLGRDTRYLRYPSVIEGLWTQFFGHGIDACYGPPGQPEKGMRKGQIYAYVLKPRLNEQ